MWCTTDVFLLQVNLMGTGGQDVFTLLTDAKFVTTNYDAIDIAS